MSALRLLTFTLAVSILIRASAAARIRSDHPSILSGNPPTHHTTGVAALTTSSWDKPDFCNKLDCPEFKEVEKTKDYEIRDYASSNWVSTNLQGVSYGAAVGTMFMKLFYYISGKNARNETIAMTAPVLNRVIPGEGPACKSNFTMSFYISPSVKNPPPPTDKTVFLSSLPKQRVYTKYFGGFAKEPEWVKNAESLGAALVRDAHDFDQSYFYTAGYDSPFKVFNRHNEVWFIAS